MSFLGCLRVAHTALYGYLKEKNIADVFLWVLRVFSEQLFYTAPLNDSSGVVSVSYRAVYIKKLSTAVRELIASVTSFRYFFAKFTCKTCGVIICSKVAGLKKKILILKKIFIFA